MPPATRQQASDRGSQHLLGETRVSTTGRCRCYCFSPNASAAPAVPVWHVLPEVMWQANEYPRENSHAAPTTAAPARRWALLTPTNHRVRSPSMKLGWGTKRLWLLATKPQRVQPNAAREPFSRYPCLASCCDVAEVCTQSIVSFGVRWQRHRFGFGRSEVLFPKRILAKAIQSGVSATALQNETMPAPKPPRTVLKRETTCEESCRQPPPRRER